MRAALVTALALVACHDNLTPAGGPDGAAAVACLPDLDGRLEADELPLRLGATARYRAGTEVAIDLAGDELDDGRTSWSFPALSGERSATPSSILERWYAGSFPSADFVLPGPPDSVYQLDARGLYLLGVASAEPDPPAGRTLLVYDQPVPVLRFPLSVGAAWTSEAASSGELAGLPFRSTDRYEVEVSDRGELGAAGVVLEDVLRVDIEVTTTPSGAPATRQRQTSFYFECIGEIARATSHADEPERNFAIARELWLLAP